MTFTTSRPSALGAMLGAATLASVTFSQLTPTAILVEARRMDEHFNPLDRADEDADEPQPNRNLNQDLQEQVAQIGEQVNRNEHFRQVQQELQQQQERQELQGQGLREDIQQQQDQQQLRERGVQEQLQRVQQDQQLQGEDRREKTQWWTILIDGSGSMSYDLFGWEQYFGPRSRWSLAVDAIKNLA
jgi:hypothetical protein